MTNPGAARLGDARHEARVRAEAELVRIGYRKTDAGWLGEISKGTTAVRVTIRLPPAFPDVLPEISVQDPDRHPVYAHVERTGKICLAPPTGALIDYDRPEQIIAESIQRASTTLFASGTTHEADLLSEFVAYWSTAETERLFSICSAPITTGPITIVQIVGTEALLAAPDRASADRWSTRTNKKLGQSKPAYAVHLQQLFVPPRFTQRMTLAELAATIERLGVAGTSTAFRAWLNQTGLPAYVLASAPTFRGDEYVQFGALIREGHGPQASQWKNGFRPGSAPLSRQISFASGHAIARLDVQRMDAAFLVERGGGSPALLKRRAIVIGCGAVGSHVCELVAALGFGYMRLIDPERLGSENVHRHVLGVDQIGRLKVDALREMVHRRFPHVDIECKSDDVFKVLETKPTFLADGVDVIVVAIGDETIERRLNSVLPRNVLRIHVWLEPLGLGGHTLVTGAARQGCYECLYRSDEIYGLVNMATLSAPGQYFQKAIGGCGGTFTPFGAIDAQRAAGEATRRVSEAILNGAQTPALHSWVTSTSMFCNAGYHLSSRGATIGEGRSRTDRDFAQPGCPVCSAP